MAERARSTVLSLVRRELEVRCGLRTSEITDLAMERALDQAVSQSGFGTQREFVAAIRPEADPDARILQHLVRRITVGETSFLRHREDIDWLRTVVFPALVSRRTADGSKQLRLWSAGCSTGEEAYTLALLALEAVGSSSGWRIQVLATDINDESLAAGRAAAYSDWSFRGVDPASRQRWFEQAGDRWRPVQALRERVHFRYLNLRDPIYPTILTQTTALDLVLCRNVFLYFQPEVIQAAMVRFWACLEGAGFVLCGPSDFLPAKPPPGLFAAVHGFAHRLERRREGADPVPGPKRVTRVATHAPPPTQSPTPAPKPPPAPAPPVVADVSPLHALLRQGRYAEALTGAKEQLDRDPLSTEVVRCAALAASALCLEDVAEWWKRHLYLAPFDAGGHFCLGLEYRRTGRDEEARRHLDTAVALLRGRMDDELLAGPDTIPIGWVRTTCESLARKRGG